MSFSFTVNGHAGSGMQGNSQEEIDAVHSLITDLLASATASNLTVTVTNLNPPEWSPDKLTTEST